MHPVHLDTRQHTLVNTLFFLLAFSRSEIVVSLIYLELPACQIIVIKCDDRYCCCVLWYTRDLIVNYTQARTLSTLLKQYTDFQVFINIHSQNH